MKARLVLEDGTEFQGTVFGAAHSVSGEVVFNTGMVGYPESLTDPSYRGQILVMTYPLVGNYGVPGDERDEHGLLRHFESERIQVAGVIVAEYSKEYSHWNAKRSLGDWLREQDVPAVTGVDTRSLTKKLREKGVMLGRIVVDEDVPLDDPNRRNLVAEVSCPEKVVYNKGGKPHILLVDCGVKNNIIRSFAGRGCEVIRVPWDYDIATEAYDGLFVSNGPGDPMMAAKTVEHLRKALQQDKPIFGICLGNQLVALAAGAKTYKLKYGHRSQNQPCTDATTGRCYITSQNHGFAVDSRTIPDGWEEWFRNENDGTNEGIRHRTKPFITVQFHPEATPGPVDTDRLFDEFLRLIACC